MPGVLLQVIPLAKESAGLIYCHDVVSPAVAPAERAIPIYGEFGLNSGVALMSLERIRNSAFNKERDDIVGVYEPQNKLPLGDQDVLNIYGHAHPEHFYELPCVYNVRYDTGCYEGLPVILHGNRQLRSSVSSPYSSLYRVFAKVDLDCF